MQLECLKHATVKYYFRTAIQKPCIEYLYVLGRMLKFQNSVDYDNDPPSKSSQSSRHKNYNITEQYNNKDIYMEQK